MTAKSFDAMIEKTSTRTLIALPFDPNEVWGQRNQHHVTGLIQGVGYRGAILFEGGRFCISIGPAWLRDIHLNADDSVHVCLEPEGPQLDNIALDIAAALTSAPEARSFFESLPTFYRKNYVRWIEQAKQVRTREARIQELIQLLAAGQRAR